MFGIEPLIAGVLIGATGATALFLGLAVAIIYFGHQRVMKWFG